MIFNAPVSVLQINITKMSDTSLEQQPIELSFPMPKAPQTLIHLHLTVNATSILLFLTTSLGGDASIPAYLGSFIYALPDVRGGIPTLSCISTFWYV